MNIIEKDINEIIPYVNNPRKNDDAVDKVAASIKEFGFKVPCVISSDNVIVTGHTRIKAAKKLGMATVPCIVADDLTEAQIKAFRLVDNKVSEFSEWDFEKLGIEFEGLAEFDLDDFGFEIDEDSISFGGSSELAEDNPFDDIEKLEKHYGVPYQGNKSRIADIIINILPAGNRLVDLFGGGGAITHCGMLSGKWDSFLYNDINEMVTGLFIDAVYGKYHDERRVITREEFNDLKDTDAFVKYIWSFGNNGLAYLWAKDIEEEKQTACHALLDETVHERRLAFVHFIKMLRTSVDTAPHRIATIERMQALEHLEALQRLEVKNIDYRDYEYQDGDIVYCDVPYEQLGKKSCDDYGVNFDSLEFYEWVKAQPYQVFFSSYEISDDSFYSVKVKTICSLIGANTNDKKVNEYLYSNQPIEGNMTEQDCD